MSDRESYTVINLTVIDYFFLDQQTVDTVVNGSQVYNGDGCQINHGVKCFPQWQWYKLYT